MEPATSNTSNSNACFDHLEIIDVKRMAIHFYGKKFIQTLTTANDSSIRIGIVKGETQWHENDDDEFIFVIQGRLYVDFESNTIEILTNQGITISKNLMVRMRAPKKVEFLRLELIGVKSDMADTSWVDPINQNKEYTYPKGISLNTSIQDLRILEGLSVRSLNVCISEKITTLKELLEFQKNNRHNFAMIRNCGRMSDKELVGICEKYRNYNFPQDEPLS